jgi:hypothetical protein
MIKFDRAAVFSNGWRLLAIVAVAFAVFFFFRSCAQGKQNNELAFRADSLKAAGDTTRIVSWRANKVLGDSLKAVERLVIQVPIRNDALDKALNRVSVLETRLNAAIKDLNVKTTGTPVTVNSNDVRTSTFRVDSTPYHAVARVDLPPPPALGSIDLHVRLDTIPLSPRLQCGPAVNGVRPATILVDYNQDRELAGLARSL